jgi:predicted nucleic acid-binding protein
MSRVVISDTSPLHYLILIGLTEILPALYTTVFIPEAVTRELDQPATPEKVRDWIARPPDWLRVAPVAVAPTSVTLHDLDQGEREAILLALFIKADLVLMDDREGVEEARRVGLSVTGTIGILDRAAELGIIELAPALDSLRQTNFRIGPSLLHRLFVEDARRRKA